MKHLFVSIFNLHLSLRTPRRQPNFQKLVNHLLIVFQKRLGSLVTLWEFFCFFLLASRCKAELFKVNPLFASYLSSIVQTDLLTHTYTGAIGAPKFAATYDSITKGPKMTLPLTPVEALDLDYEEISSCDHIRREEYKN